MGTKFSQFLNVGQLQNNDILVGLRNGNNAQFTWPSGSQCVIGSLTNAQVCAMYASPITLIAAPGTGYGIILMSAYFQYVYHTAAFTDGGNIGLQYGTTAALGGTNALLGNSSNIVSSTLLTAHISNYMALLFSNANTSPMATSGITNQPISISNLTAAFTPNSGTSSLNYELEYIVVPMT